MKFSASLRAEFLKTKRTSIWYLTVLVAAIIPIFSMFDYIPPHTYEEPFDSWMHHYRQCQAIFTFALLPLFIVLASTLLLQLEVKSNTWKQILGSPQSYVDIIGAKFLVLQTIIASTIILFNLLMLGNAAVLESLTGRQFLNYLDHWPEIIKINTRLYFTTLGMSSLCFWIALQFKNFIVPVGAGFLLWLIGPLALELKLPYIDRYVFILPATSFIEKYSDDAWLYLALSIGYSVLFLSIAAIGFMGRYVQFGWHIGERLKP